MGGGVRGRGGVGLGGVRLDVNEELKFLGKWSCKHSPDYFPGINTTVKQEKGATSIFRCSRAANSVVPDQIWPNSELIQALMYVIVTCKYEKDLIKNS